MDYNKPVQLADLKGSFSHLAPAGFYVALRVGFYSPEDECNAFSETWVQHYTACGFAVQDPLMRWTFTNHGARRWSEIDLPDPAGVLAEYARFMLRYGVALCLPGQRNQPKRSFGLFAREDREYSDGEISELTQLLSALHNQEPQALTESQAEVLRMLSAGMRHKEMAYALSISQSAVKARLKAAAQRMNAKTAAQAASLASMRGLL